MTFPVECQYHAPMEPPDFDEDDGYRGQITILSRRTLTARIEHRCDGYTFDDDRRCRRPILPGHRYERQFWLFDDGGTLQVKKHVGCYHAIV